MITHGFNIKTIEDQPIVDKRVLVRVDFDISINDHHKIADDTRLKESLPTIQYLLKHKNRLILVSKLNRPKHRDEQHSLKIVAKKLHDYLPCHEIIVVDDFLSSDKKVFENQKQNQVLLLENIRFYQGEEKNDPTFAKQLASLADVFVQDAFAMLHREEASITGITKYLPSYAGLLLEKEIAAIAAVMDHPKKPVVTISGGAKISDKIPLLAKLIDMSDYLLLGGGIANTFLLAQGKSIGRSLAEEGELVHARELMKRAKEKGTEILLPADSCGKQQGEVKVYKTDQIPHDFSILDIGPETQAFFATVIMKAHTIIWNGPVGYIEDEQFARGTDFLYYTITQNEHAYSLVGGGDTIAAISKMEYLDKITHISTGGGAMLEFIEKGTLPGIEALKKNQSFS